MGSTPRSRTLGRPLALALLLSLGVGHSAVRANEPAKDLPKGGEGAAVAPEKVKPTLRPKTPKEGKQFKSLIEAGRIYFDTDEELWTGHKAFRDELQGYAKKDKHLLGDYEFLTWLVSQSRSFLPQMDDRKWARSVDLDLIDHRAWGVELKGRDGTWLHVREPKGYAKRNKDLEKTPRADPSPAVVLLHEKQDTSQADGAGKSAIERSYPKGSFDELTEEWFTLVPIAAAAAYVEGGRIRRKAVLDPMRAMWQHYHIDFDRLLVDGGEAVLPLLGASASFFAGAIVRGGALDTPKLKASVINYAHVPVYVVDDEALAASLREAGHPNVTAGKADAKLLSWMKERRRTWPKAFEWNLIEDDQGLAWWINIDQAIWDAGKPRRLKVECLDTPDNPNTIKIEAIGVSEVSLFLSDAVVDLGRKVRVVINDRIMYDAAAEVPEHLAPLTRDMQTLFLHETLDVRASRYYGWLMGLVIPRLEVPEPPKEEAAPVEPEAPEVVATPRQEAQAGKLLAKAKASCKAGDHDEGRRLLDRALTLPKNKFTEEIRTMRERLGDG